jgi:hypothetical protein
VKPDAWLWRHWLETSESHWREGDLMPDVMAMIAASCGWNPLVAGETMTVGIAGNRYRITRLKEEV